MSANNNKRIPVYAGDHLIEYCDPSRAARLGSCSNVEVTRARKGRVIVRLTIRPVDSPHDDAKGHTGNDLALTYDETIGGQAVTVLKRYDAETGQFVYWSDKDSFDPLRFNPDRLPVSRVGAAR